MTEEQLLSRVCYDLCRSPDPIQIRPFVQSFFPNDVKAGRTLARLFDRQVVRGRLDTNLVDFDGHISHVKFN